MMSKKTKKYTYRLVIKMTEEDMCLLESEALRHGLPFTSYARTLILNQINPLIKK